MTLPIDLVLVRHGESEGNVANRHSREGDNRYFTAEFLARHSSSFRLSPRGREQAEAAGRWLRENLCRKRGFDRYITSDYVRARETAGLLSIPNAAWYRNFYLRERGWGPEMDNLPDDQRRARFYHILRMKDTEPFYWQPIGGESMADLCLRIDRVLQTLHREGSDKRVILVCHAEVMWAFRVLLERIPQEIYKELDLSRKPEHHIHNCQILHYSRRDPETCALTPYANWVRSVCPWDFTLSTNVWTPIVRPRFSNEELLADVEKIPSMIEE